MENISLLLFLRISIKNESPENLFLLPFFSLYILEKEEDFEQQPLVLEPDFMLGYFVILMGFLVVGKTYHLHFSKLFFQVSWHLSQTV